MPAQTSLAGGPLQSILGNGALPDFRRRLRYVVDPGANYSRVDFAIVPSEQNCRFHLFIEGEAQLKKFELPSSDCVEVVQRFDAQPGDMLSFDHVFVLRSGQDTTATSSAVNASLVNRNDEFIHSILDLSIDGSGGDCRRCIASNSREAVSFAIPAAGHYELRFVAAVDANSPGSEVHFLVDAGRVVSHSGVVVKRLASLGCVGCVRQQLPV